MKYREAKISDITQIVKVNIVTWRITYQGILSEEYLQSLSYEEIVERWKKIYEKEDDRKVIYVAETNYGEI